MTMTPPDYDDITAAVARIEGHAVVTPLLSSPRVNEELGGEIHIKPECLQRTGSFKFRGACNAIAMLDDATECVVAWSSGNHAQAVAAAASARGFRSIIVMPEDSPVAKINGTRALGGEVITYDRYHQNREEIGIALAQENNAVIIPPYDYPPVIAGQGTIGVEIAEACMERDLTPDQMICCTGGGGLLAGTSIALRHHFNALEIIGAEPEGFDDFARSIEAGERVSNASGARSICDAIVTPTPGKITFAVNQALVSHGVAVSDDEVLDAMAFAWAQFKIVAEPGGAVALAAALSGKVDITDRKTVIVVSGGNVDHSIFEQALKRL